MELARGELGRFLPDPGVSDVERALQRFIGFCQFEPETGCVVWTGGKTQGRGHHVPYGSFWFNRRRWFAHRWAARFIHKLDIDEFHVDHCCPNIAHPNTLCVEHLQPLTLLKNVAMQHERRRNFIHLQVGLLQYSDLYGPDPAPEEDKIPFFTPPAWLKSGDNHGHADDDCPF